MVANCSTALVKTVDGTQAPVPGMLESGSETLKSRRRSWVEVSCRQIAENFCRVRAVVGPAVEIAPVVKADAYGHGAIQTARVLARVGARWLAVSNLEEGAVLRQSGYAGRILVMADCLAFHDSALFELDLTPVIHSFADLAELDRMAKAAQRSMRYHLKVDTGMTRFGVPSQASEVLAAVREARAAELEGLMTHFASSTDYSSTQSEDQIARLKALIGALRHAGVVPYYIHLSSSNPVAYGRRPEWENMVRPGLAIYGYVLPARGLARPPLLDVKPALTWKATILAVRHVAAGARVGYGALYRAPQGMRIGVLAVGYADGYPHSLSNHGIVIAGGKPAPVVGAVSMDVTTIDLSQAPHLSQAMRSPCSARKATSHSMHSNSHAAPARFLTVCCATSTRGSSGCTWNSGVP